MDLPAGEPDSCRHCPSGLWYTKRAPTVWRADVLRCDPPNRLEAVLYSLTAVAQEVLALRHPALGQLQLAAAWASTACVRAPPAAPAAADTLHQQAAAQVRVAV